MVKRPALSGRGADFSGRIDSHRYRSPQIYVEKEIMDRNWTQILKVNAAALLAIHPGECYDTANFLEWDLRRVRGWTSTKSELSDPLTVRCPEGGKISSDQPSASCVLLWAKVWAKVWLDSLRRAAL
jgi:hypothetical protein